MLLHYIVYALSVPCPWGCIHIQAGIKYNNNIYNEYTYYQELQILIITIINVETHGITTKNDVGEVVVWTPHVINSY